MITVSPDLIESSPSPPCIGLTGSWFTAILYLPVACFWPLANFMVNGIIYLSVPDVTGQVDQAITNSAFVTGVLLFVRGVVNTIVNMQASTLSDGSRLVLTAASYAHPVIITDLESLVWWLLIAIHPLLFVMGRKSFPLGVDSRVFVLSTWAACDEAGHFIGGLTRCIGSAWKWVFVLVGTILLGIYAIGASITWLVLALVHKSGYLPPMRPAFYLLGLVSLTVIISGWPLTASGHIRRVGWTSIPPGEHDPSARLWPRPLIIRGRGRGSFVD